jgi:hypothetical protein
LFLVQYLKFRTNLGQVQGGHFLVEVFGQYIDLVGVLTLVLP